ncbi:hypothetical protein AYX13_01909 [Cryptococcus neoformans]|nr:hypothetical protein AYX13_01909 [Cryptococcus neoformans var. grubii]
MSSSNRPVRPAYTLKLANTKNEVEACYDIRMEVFCVEQGFTVEDEMDEYDPHSFHFLLTTPISSPPDVSTSSLPPTNDTSTTTEKPIGTIRFVPGKSKLTRLAILKDYRKFGFGKVLVKGMEHFVRQNAVKEPLGKIIEEEGEKWINIKCHSQIHAIPFYEKLGYVAEGPQFDEDGAPHQLLVHRLQVDDDYKP